MYLRGLVVDPETGAVYDDGSPDGVQSIPPEPTGIPPSSAIDWPGIVDKALTVWGRVETTRAQTQAARMPTMTAGPVRPPVMRINPATGQPAYYPASQGGAFGFSANTLILFGVGALVLFILMRNR